jgi:dynein light chain LC8-type
MAQHALTAVMKICEMDPEMQAFALEIGMTAAQQKSGEQEIASYIKKTFEEKYQPNWHCVVGRNFGAHVTFEAKHYIYFYIGQMGILLFKSA